MDDQEVGQGGLFLKYLSSSSNTVEYMRSWEIAGIVKSRRQAVKEAGS